MAALELFLSLNFILEINCYEGFYRLYATNTLTKESYSGSSIISLDDAAQKMLAEMRLERGA